MIILNIERVHLYITKTLYWARWRLKSQALDYLLNRLFRRRSKKASKLRVTGLCEGKSPVTGEFPAQRASIAENASIWWRHHQYFCWNLGGHMAVIHNWATTSATTSQTTDNSTVCSTVCSCVHQKEHQSSAWLTLCEGNPPEDRWIPSQMVSKAEYISMLWRHRVCRRRHKLKSHKISFVCGVSLLVDKSFWRYYRSIHSLVMVI